MCRADTHFLFYATPTFYYQKKKKKGGRCLVTCQIFITPSLPYLPFSDHGISEMTKTFHTYRKSRFTTGPHVYVQRGHTIVFMNEILTKLYKKMSTRLILIEISLYTGPKFCSVLYRIQVLLVSYTLIL